MSALTNRLMAWTDAYFMRRTGLAPATIIDVGASSCPESWAWETLFPGVSILCIEPKMAKPNGRPWHWVRAALAAKASDEPSYCPICWGAWKCRRPVSHKHCYMPTTTLDLVVKESGLPGPYYLWIDVDGNEVDILSGAAETLAKTRFMHAEIMDGERGEGLSAWLYRHGWLMVYEHKRTATLSVDRLYLRNGK